MIFRNDFMIYISPLEFCCQDEDFDPDAPLPPVPPDPPQDVGWHLSTSMAFMAAVLKIQFYAVTFGGTDGETASWCSSVARGHGRGLMRCTSTRLFGSSAGWGYPESRRYPIFLTNKSTDEARQHNFEATRLQHAQSLPWSMLDSDGTAEMTKQPIKL